MLNHLIEENQVINAFIEYLEEKEIESDEIIAEDVNDFLMGYYWEIFDNSDSMEEIEKANDEVTRILYENFTIKRAFHIFNNNGKYCATCRTEKQAKKKIKELKAIDEKLSKKYNSKIWLATYVIKEF